MSGVEEAPVDGVAADRGKNEEGDTVRDDVRSDVQVTTLGGECSEREAVHTDVKLEGMEDKAAMKEGHDKDEEADVAEANNPLMQLQLCGPPAIPHGVASNGVTPNVATSKGVSSNAGCKGTTRGSVDYAKNTIANAKEILRHSDKCVMSESKLGAEELNDIAEILHSKDGEMASVGGRTLGRKATHGGGAAAVGHDPAGDTTNVDMTALFENSNSSLPFILKGISDTLDHILSVDKMKNNNKTQLIQVVQNAHMLLRSNYNLVLKCDSNLAIIVKKIKRLYRLYRRLDRPARMSTKVQKVVEEVTEVLPIGRNDMGEVPFTGDTHSAHGGSSIQGTYPHEQDGTRVVDKPIEEAPTKEDDHTNGCVQGGDKEVHTNDLSNVASSVACGYGCNVGEANLHVNPPCEELKPDGGKGNDKETLLTEGSHVETLLEAVVPPAITVGADQGLPHAHRDETTVKDCPQGDTQADSNCVGKEECPLSSKQLSYAFVKGEDGQSYKNLTSIDSKSTAMSNHKDDAGSSITTEGRKTTEERKKKKKKTQRELSGGNEAEMHSAHTGHPARNSRKERNKNKKKEREKKRILRELSRLNSLFFFTFNHKGDIINYLHREICSNISQFDAAYQLYMSK
ncbi:hypothetical protein AK88_03862 [Plasmodium fragile]|uniref:Uncharacterized protein n=1 Tax=Plasmodium fragile TaxID=5857 RepID=A0A0D9QL75_PLAFR|nr:uncharacterized protein AK88_03862 [Plasmodium fragile]KJP86486.1 hypothetical protein AK88_03862 [Plasmodium fragile]